MVPSILWHTEECCSMPYCCSTLQTACSHVVAAAGLYSLLTVVVTGVNQAPDAYVGLLVGCVVGCLEVAVAAAA